MVCLIPLTILILACLDAAIIQMFRYRRAKVTWWIALSCAWSIGAAIGFWSGFFFEYQPSPHLRVCGFPVPGAFFHWEGPPGEEDWVDYITPAPLTFAGSNILIVSLATALPVGLLFRFREIFQSSR